MIKRWIALILTMGVMMGISSSAYASLPPAPPVVCSISWTADNYLQWSVSSSYLTTYIIAVDYREIHQVIGPAPAGSYTLKLDMNNVPSPQYTTIVWRISGFSQGSQTITLRRPIGTPLFVARIRRIYRVMPSGTR